LADGLAGAELGEVLVHPLGDGVVQTCWRQSGEVHPSWGVRGNPVRSRRHVRRVATVHLTGRAVQVARCWRSFTAEIMPQAQYLWGLEVNAHFRRTPCFNTIVQPRANLTRSPSHDPLPCRADRTPLPAAGRPRCGDSRRTTTCPPRGAGEC